MISLKTDNQLNVEAIQLRETWGLNPNGSIDITSVVLSKLPNLTLLYIPFSENTSGMCINDGNIKIIGINSTMTKGRQRFTLAHELYHLLIEENTGKPIICNNPLRDDSEREADKFASYLLMSEEGLSQYCDMNNIDEWNLSNIISVEQYFQISHHALLIRLLNNRLISKKEFDEYKGKYISYEARIRGYGDELYRPSPKEDQYMTLGKYINTIEYLDETNKISQSKKKELLLDGYRGDLVFNVDKGDDIND